MSGLVSGLQNRPRRFESACDLKKEMYLYSICLFFYLYLPNKKCVCYIA